MSAKFTIPENVVVLHHIPLATFIYICQSVNILFLFNSNNFFHLDCCNSCKFPQCGMNGPVGQTRAAGEDVPGTFHSTVRERTATPLSGDKLRHHNKGSGIPGQQTLQISLVNRSESQTHSGLFLSSMRCQRMGKRFTFQRCTLQL